MKNDGWLLEVMEDALKNAGAPCGTTFNIGHETVEKGLQAALDAVRALIGRPPRKYTFAEIDRMRKALQALSPVTYVVKVCSPRDVSWPEALSPLVQTMHLGSPSCEDTLRTHMLNGTTPEELEAEVRKREEEAAQRRVEEAARDHACRVNASLRKIFKPKGGDHDRAMG